MPIRRAKFVAYTLSGLLASMAGLFLTFITSSGEASAANGSTYTLYSIAAVVLGGVSLFGGAGSAIGAIFGALMFRTIGDLLFVFNVEPLWQPLFQGVVLMLAVCVTSFWIHDLRLWGPWSPIHLLSIFTLIMLPLAVWQFLLAVAEAFAIIGGLAHVVLRQRDYFMPGPQALFGFARTAAFRERAAELGRERRIRGVDASRLGLLWIALRSYKLFKAADIFKKPSAP